MSNIDEAFLAERERITFAICDGEKPWLVCRRDPLSHLSIDSEAGTPMARCPMWGDEGEAERVAAHLVDAHNHQPALIAEIRRLRAMLVESDEARASAESELGWRILQKDSEDA